MVVIAIDIGYLVPFEPDCEDDCEDHDDDAANLAEKVSRRPPGAIGGMATLDQRSAPLYSSFHCAAPKPSGATPERTRTPPALDPLTDPIAPIAPPPSTALFSPLDQMDRSAERRIAHIVLDDFYPSVEIRDNPWLRGRPIVVGGMSARGLVCAVSAQAAQRGIQPGMPMKAARAQYGDAAFVKTRINHYKEISRQARKILDDSGGLVEEKGLDRFFVDMTGVAPPQADALDVARMLKEEVVGRVQLPVTVCVAHCKLLAQLGAEESGPDGLRAIAPDQAREFLHPLPVERLPGVDPRLARNLHIMGAGRVAHLAAIPPSVLEQAFGRFGARLFEYAHGVDTRPVNPARESKSLSCDKTFETATTDQAAIRQALGELAEALELRLKAKGCQARAVMVKARFDDFATVSRSRTFETCFRSAAIIADQAESLLNRAGAGGRPLRGVGLSVSHFHHADEAEQLSLFGQDHPMGLL